MKSLRTILLIAVATTTLAYSTLVAPRPNAQMAAVLKELGSMNPPPPDKQEPRVARDEPSPADAVASLLSKRGKPTVMAVGDVGHKVIPGPGGDLLLRLYVPKGKGPFPVVVYFHGGGWVIANLNTYDASCRAITNMAKSMVVSVAYRQAPEHKFPAAHDDAYAAAKWVMANAASIGGDPRRVAIMGESAGGNLAAATCLRMKEQHDRLPVAQILVYPIAGYDFDTPSYRENADAKPLNKPMMMWFFKQYLRTPEDGRSPYISLVHANNLSGLPPATVVTAEIDPLRSEGEMYAKRLRDAGVRVSARRYAGVTHEFFGMGAVVKEAKDAEMYVAASLRTAFMGRPTKA